MKSFTESVVTRGFDAWLTSMGTVATPDFLVFKDTCKDVIIPKIKGYLEFASFRTAFHFLEEKPMMHLPRACRAGLGIGGAAGVLVGMWHALPESATERAAAVVDMVQVELMDGCVDVREMEGKEPSQILIESMQKRLVEMKNKCKWIEFL